MPNLANSCAGSSARNLTQTRYARVLLVLLAARLPYLTERTVVRVVMHKNLTQTRYARGFNTVRVLLHTISYGMVPYGTIHPAAITNETSVRLWRFKYVQYGTIWYHTLTYGTFPLPSQ